MGVYVSECELCVVVLSVCSFTFFVLSHDCVCVCVCVCVIFFSFARSHAACIHVCMYVCMYVCVLV